MVKIAAFAVRMPRLSKNVNRKLHRSYAIIARNTPGIFSRANRTAETENSRSHIYFCPGKMNAVSAASVSSLFLVAAMPMSAALFLPDFGLCPGGIETMADFDMAQVSEGKII